MEDKARKDHSSDDEDKESRLMGEVSSLPVDVLQVLSSKFGSVGELTQEWLSVFANVDSLVIYLFEDDDFSRFRQTVDIIVQNRNEPYLHKLDIFVCNFKCNDMDYLLEYALNRKVESLAIELPKTVQAIPENCSSVGFHDLTVGVGLGRVGRDGRRVESSYCLPFFVLNSNLSRLFLSNVRVDFCQTINMGSLKDLGLLGIKLKQQYLTDIVLGAPLLEELEVDLEGDIRNLDVDENNGRIIEDFSITSSRLRVLKIKHNSARRSELRISACRLVTLHLLGLWKSLLSLEANALESARVDYLHGPHNHAERRGQMIYFKRLLRELQHVHRIAFNEWSCRLLVDVMRNENELIFPTTTSLSLDCLEGAQLINGLAMFPSLEALVIELKQDHTYLRTLPATQIPVLPLQSLVQIYITWTIQDVESVKPAIQSLLENTQKLEMMSIKLIVSNRDVQLFHDFEQAVLAFPKCSASANVVVIRRI